MAHTEDESLPGYTTCRSLVGCRRERLDRVYDSSFCPGTPTPRTGHVSSILRFTDTPEEIECQ